MEARRAEADREGPTDASSFVEFYRREYPSVAGFAYVLTGDHAAAEDLAQDAFLAARQAWLKVSRYDQPDLAPGSVASRANERLSPGWRRPGTALPRRASGQRLWMCGAKSASCRRARPR